MNGLIWTAQVILAAVFIVAGIAKLVGYQKVVNVLQRRRGAAPHQLPTRVARLVGVLEIAGALGVIWPASATPAALGPDYLLVRIAASCLGAIMIAAAIYHTRRKESAAPAIAAFLLALFVIVGRWPH